MVLFRFDFMAYSPFRAFRYKTCACFKSTQPLQLTHSILQRFQQRNKLRQAVNLKVRMNLQVRRAVVWVKPAGLHTGVDTAEDVAGRTVTDQDRLIRVKIRNSRKAAIKILLARLISADMLGDEDLFKKRRNSRAFESSLLHRGVSV